MAVQGKRVTVGNTATVIAVRDGDGQFVTIKNGATGIDLGDSTVTSGAGYAMAANDVLANIRLDPGEELYGITASGSSIVQVLGTRVG